MLAHELSHVSQRHIARSIAASSRRSLVSLAALILGLLAAVAQQQPRRDQRRRRRHARRRRSRASSTSRATWSARPTAIGFQVMTAAGFAPGGMAAMFEKMDTVDPPQRLRRLPLPAHPPADGRAHRRGALARQASSRARGRCGVERPRAHRGAGARAGADGHARRRAAPLAGAATPTREGSAADKLLAALRERARRRACCATGRVPTPPSPRRCAIARASPSSGARAERAVALMQAQSLLDRGAPAKASGGDARLCGRRLASGRCCSSAQIALAAITAVTADSAALQGSAPATCRPGSTLRPDDSLAWGALGQTWGRLGQPLRALRAEAESRYRARRPARRGRPAARRPAPRPQRRPGRLHRRLGDRLAAARSTRSAQIAPSARPTLSRLGSAAAAAETLATLGTSRSALARRVAGDATRQSEQVGTDGGLHRRCWRCRAGVVDRVAGAAAIVAVTPQGEVAQVRQVTVKFSEAVVAFGDPRLADPFALACQGAVPAGAGRWANDRVWLYDFREPLPPGTRVHARSCARRVEAERCGDAARPRAAPLTGPTEFALLHRRPGDRLDAAGRRRARSRRTSTSCCA